MNQPRDNRDLLTEGLSHHLDGRLQEAESLYRRVLQEHPIEYDALYLLGVALRQQERLELSFEMLEKARLARPDYAKTYVELGAVNFGLKRLVEAIAYLEMALKLQPHFPEAHEYLGHAYHEFCYFEKAAAHYQNALAQEPHRPIAKSNLDIIAQREQQLTAFAEESRSILLGSDRPEGLNPAGTRTLESRDILPHLLNRLGLTESGAEIGVQKASFSEHLLRHWKGRLLYSIDPWREFSNESYVDVANVPQSKHDRFYRDAIRKLMPFQQRSVIWRLTSREAAELIPDQSLDFCYIDADHSYNGVSEDIRLWYPKVRPGGLMGGHDFIQDGSYTFGIFGVQRAVNEFVASNKAHLFLSGESEVAFPSWFVLKRK